MIKFKEKNSLNEASKYKNTTKMEIHNSAS